MSRVLPAFDRRLFLKGLTMSLALMPTAPVHAATRVETVTSPGGIAAWLVRQTQLPILAIDFAFRGGATQDDPARAGTAAMAAAMLDEGAGPLDMAAFANALDDRAIEMSFSAGRETFSGSLRCLTEHQDEAARLLALALTAPRFDRTPMERIRQSLLSGARQATTNPNSIASETFWATAFPGHPYGRRPAGTEQTVAAIAREDLQRFHGAVLARDTLKVAVVGNITADALGPLLDRVFGALPARSSAVPVPPATMQGLGTRRVMPLDVPQTAISFGLPGLKRDDPDFITAFVLLQILGGGSSSRLFQEVREKRGLAYSVSASLSPFDVMGLVSGGTSTRNDRAAESLAVIAAELARMGANGPDETERRAAQRFLVGSWALRFDTSNAIAGNLLRLQQDGFAPDYLDRRNSLIEAVTLDDLARVARRLFADPRPLVVAVGQPVGL